jgi:phosphate/sulfate permease
MIPARFAPILFGFILSGLMSAIVSAIVTARVLDAGSPFIWQWFRSWISSWLVAFPAVLLIAPLTRRLVGKLTRPD